MIKLNILVGCEESQAVTKEFRKLGHEAFSCDLVEQSGGHPEWHLQMDVFEAIKLKDWDMGLFFPTCTYLTVSANKFYKDQPPLKSGKLVGQARRDAREKAIQFVIDLYNCGIDKICIENPIGVLSTRWRKWDQIIHPHMFGENASKSTCLWLKNLPKLVPTEHVEPEYYHNGLPRWGNQSPSGANKLGPSKDRARLRSKTFPGIAKAMAIQYHEYLEGVL